MIGVKKRFDFYGILFLHDYPAFRLLKNVDEFKKFNGSDTLEWNNGNIDITPETLYENGKSIS